jgi:hypothetical protein
LRLNALRIFVNGFFKWDLLLKPSNTLSSKRIVLFNIFSGIILFLVFKVKYVDKAELIDFPWGAHLNLF